MAHVAEALMINKKNKNIIFTSHYLNVLKRDQEWSLIL